MSPDLTFNAITGFRLVTAAPERMAAFYRAIGFEVGEATPILMEEMGVLGLRGGGFRRTMTLGPTRVDLDVFDRPGRGYPTGATACDHIFQHLALVTDDADAAWRMAREAGATPISRGRPIRLPQSAGGVTAIKFRDPEREGHLHERIRFFCRPSLLIVDEIGYLPVVHGGGNLFFQLVNARYERGAMILTSNRGFAEWGEVFGDPVVATALLDRLLHHAIVIQIEGSSYRLRQHAELMPEHVRSKALITPPAVARPRGRPPKNGYVHPVG